MTIEENKAFVRQGFEALNRGDMQDIFASLAPNFVYHDAANPQVRTREEYLQFLTGIMAAFSYQATVEDLIAEGEKVVRFTLRGTHQGHWRGIPPTGNPMVVTVTSTYRIQNGQTVEMWQNADVFSSLQQMGVLAARR